MKHVMRMEKNIKCVFMHTHKSRVWDCTSGEVEVVARWGLASPPRQPVIKKGEMTSGCTREAQVGPEEKTFSVKE